MSSSKMLNNPSPLRQEEEEEGKLLRKHLKVEQETELFT